MTQPAVLHLRRPLLPLARVAVMLAIGAACHVAQAAVIQTPYCLVCAVNNMPAADDELVIRGFFVRFGGNDLVSPGLLTNNAFNLVNNHNLQAMVGMRNNTWFTNSGRLSLAGGSLTNQPNALFNNRGQATGALDSRLINHGTVNNQAGGYLKMAFFSNSGQTTNSAGATLSVGSTLANETGGKLVNRGVINVGPDARLVLHQGSSYDFQGGTLNIEPVGRLYLNRDFTIGDVQGGQINLGFDSRIFNAATMRMANTQATIGDISNTGTVINDGNWRHEGVLTGAGALRNNGTFTAQGYVRTTAFTQSVGQTVVEGNVGLGQAVVEQGAIEVKAGAVLSADTLTLNGGLSAEDGLMSMGSLFIEEDGWLDLAGASLALTGDFIDGSLVTELWQTGDASLSFDGSGLHRFGIGLGSHDWGSLTLDAAGSYEFFGGGSLRVGAFAIEGGDLSLLSAITGDATIYYDPTLAANAYLNGQSYGFGQGSGQLVAWQAAPEMTLATSLPAMSAMAVTAVPEAGHGVLVLAGLAVVMGLRGRRAIALR